MGLEGIVSSRAVSAVSHGAREATRFPKKGVEWRTRSLRLSIRIPHCGRRELGLTAIIALGTGLIGGGGVPKSARMMRAEPSVFRDGIGVGGTSSSPRVSGVPVRARGVRPFVFVYGWPSSDFHTFCRIVSFRPSYYHEVVTSEEWRKGEKYGPI